MSEQRIIANNKDSREIFIFHLEEKCLVHEKVHGYDSIKEIIPLFTPIKFKDLINVNFYEKEKKFDEKILIIESDKLILYK